MYKIGYTKGNHPLQQTLIRVTCSCGKSNRCDKRLVLLTDRHASCSNDDCRKEVVFKRYGDNAIELVYDKKTRSWLEKDGFTGERFTEQDNMGCYAQH